MQETSATRHKLVVVGDGVCGKTSLLIAFAQDVFYEETIPTVFDTYIGNTNVDGLTIQFALFDTAGQEDYDRLRPLSYPNSDVIVACFNIDNRDSFTNIPNRWMPEIRHFCPRTPVILAATKVDLRQDEVVAARTGSRRAVTASEGAELSAQIKAAKYVECSAKTREGVQEVFTAAARAVLGPPRQSGTKRIRCVLL